jgi:hypothetical protein
LPSFLTTLIHVRPLSFSWFPNGRGVFRFGLGDEIAQLLTALRERLLQRVSHGKANLDRLSSAPFMVVLLLFARCILQDETQTCIASR